MDLPYLIRVINRHRVVVAVTILMTTLVAVGLVRRIEPAFEASGSMLILTQSPSGTPAGATPDLNPLRNAGQVSSASTAMIQVMQSDAVVERLRAEGITDPYTLTLPETGSGAIMTLHTQSGSSVGALVEYTLLVQAVQEELRALQQRAGVAENIWIEARELSTPTQASSLSGSKVRVLGGVFFLGFGASLALAFVADALYGDNRRPLRRPFHRGTPVGDHGEAMAGNGPEQAAGSDESAENNLDLILSLFDLDRDPVGSGKPRRS